MWQCFLLLSMALTVTANDYCGQYNCYQLLGVARDAEETTIKKAFREMARKYHPDKNKENTLQLFQMINKAYEILTDDKSRFKYNLHLQHPEQSQYYHEYQYYHQRYIQDPQIHPAIVVSVFLGLISLLQYVMRKQMYERALIHIAESQDFKTKLNERCGKDKKMKEAVREEMIKEISVEGGYSKPSYKEILAYRLLILPYTICHKLWRVGRWVYKYYIRRQEYTAQDQEYLTKRTLDLSDMRWEHANPHQKADLISRKLWVKANRKKYEEEMKAKWLEQLREENPRKYNMVMKHMRKYQ